MSRDLVQLQKCLPTSWESIITPIQKQLEEVNQKIQEEQDKIPGLSVFPLPAKTFSALQQVEPINIKVVIIGQDCYHQPGQAIGLAFGVPSEVRNPPSLVNIIREIRSDVGQLITDSSLMDWAAQGVLLLNSALTVHQAKPGSHLKHWKKYTDLLIRNISQQTDSVVWLLWGNYAKSKRSLIHENNHLILEANHPSPLSANRGGWFGCKHFSQTNTFLRDNHQTEIVWGKDES